MSHCRAAGGRPTGVLWADSGEAEAFKPEDLGLMRLLADLAALAVEQVIEAARQGDATSLAALQEVGKYLGIGIANLMNIFNPQMVVLGGALNSASDILLPIVERVVAANAMGLVSEDVKIIASAHGTEACVMGAVALVLDDILREPTFA